MRRRCLVCILLVCCLSLAGCAAAPPHVPRLTLRYAENQCADYPTTRGAQYFADLVYQRTQGDIQILVYPDEALGDEGSVVEQLMFGGIDFSRISLSLLSGYSSALNVLQLPYLYEDGAHMWRVLDSQIGTKYLQSISALGFHALAWLDAGARSFYTSDPSIRTPLDLAGASIRVQESALMQHTIECFHATAVPMRFSEVLEALETGKITGAENNLPSYLSTGHYAAAPYFIEDQHTRIPEVMLVSNQLMDSLTPDEQEILLNAAKEAALFERQLWSEYEQEARKSLIDKGVTIFSLSAQEEDETRALLQSVYRDFAGDYMDVIIQIRSYARK